MRTLYLSDITMLSSLEAGGFTLSFREKIELSKLLDRLCLDVIELAPIRDQRIDPLLVKSVASAVKHATVALSVGRGAESVELAWNALKGAAHPRLQLHVPVSPSQMEYFWHKKPAKLLDEVRELIALCRERCAEVEFIADDATRAEPAFLKDALRAAASAGANVLTLCDDAGAMLPDEFGAFLSDLKASVPEIEGLRLGIKCSNAMEMACACATAALRCGVSEIKTVSCAADGTRLTSFFNVLSARGGALGVSCGLRGTEIRRITEQIERMCHGARSERSPFDSGVNGMSEDFVVSVHDDRAAVLAAVKRIGYDLSEEDAAKVYEAFLRIAGKKETLGARELDTIVASAAMQVPATFKLDHYVINCGNMISASAHMRLERNGEKLEGICLGDGPIDAAFLAIEQITGEHNELDDFQIQAVTEGTEAMGEALVRLRANGKLYSGRGISTDIVGASIDAYLSALNKIVYEEVGA